MSCVSTPHHVQKLTPLLAGPDYALGTITTRTRPPPDVTVNRNIKISE
jgi:hypothetical protein